MPNWTTNRVVIEGDESTLNNIKEFLQTGEQLFDFNKVIPMPDELNVVAGGIMDEAIKIAHTRKGSVKRAELMSKITLPYDLSMGGSMNIKYGPALLNTEDDVVTLGKIYINNEKKYGYSNWYDWRNANWDTKWNANSCQIDTTEAGQLSYLFCTAWCEPTAVFIALSKKYPDVVITNYANYEDPEPWRTFVTKFVNGEVTSQTDGIDEDAKAAYDCLNDDSEEEDTDNA